MKTDLNIQFLREKIESLQTALFINESSSLLKVSTHVVNVKAVDHAGNIWFVVPFQSQFLYTENAFAAKMDFFKKGSEFYIKIKGIASVVAHEEEYPESLSADIKKKVASKEAIVIRVRIRHADYFETTPRPAQNWIQQSGSQIFNWLLNPKYDHKNPQLVAIPITLEP
jgi:hypothetical protein